jgi:hypothetical protein
MVGPRELESPTSSVSSLNGKSHSNKGSGFDTVLIRQEHRPLYSPALSFTTIAAQRVVKIDTTLGMQTILEAITEANRWLGAVRDAIGTIEAR